MTMINAEKIRFLARPALLSSLLLFCLPTLASEVVGKLQFVTGEVHAVSTDGTIRLLKKGDQIHTGDIIKSAEGGTAQVIMQDQNRLVVRSATELLVKEFKFDPEKPQETKSLIKLQHGAIRSFSVLNDEGEAGKHFIETPLATVGVGAGDREIIHIKPDTSDNSPVKDLPTGTFSKVYAGQAVFESPQGNLTIGKHQAGYVTGTPGLAKKPVAIGELPASVEKQLGASQKELLTASKKLMAATKGTRGENGQTNSMLVDVDKTPSPAGPVPIPYPNIGMSSDPTKGTNKVKIDNKAVVLKNQSIFQKSAGNEAGTQKVVVSPKTIGTIDVLKKPATVKVESNNVVRHLDMTTHNHQ